MPPAKLYVDHLSQPCRAVMIFARANKLDVEEVLVKIFKLEQRSPDYLRLNPLGKIPLLVEHDGFALPESCAILRYLCTSRAVPDHWYPKDARARARCDAAMDWHHSSLRRGTTQLFFVYYMLPLRKGGKFKPGPREEMTATEGLKMLQDALKQMESYWLEKGRFVVGADVSIADLILANEISELDLLAAAPSSPHKAEDLLAPFPRVRAWLADVRRACEPHWDAAHAKLNAIVANSAGGAAKL